MPKYKVGDDVLIGVKRFEVVEIDLNRRTNIYTVRGARGGLYIAGDHNITGRAGEVSKSESVDLSRRKRSEALGGASGKRGQKYALWMAQEDPSNSERWNLVSKLTPGDTITLRRSSGKQVEWTFVGVNQNAPKYSVEAQDPRGRIFRFSINSVVI